MGTRFKPRLVELWGFKIPSPDPCDEALNHKTQLAHELQAEDLDNANLDSHSTSVWRRRGGAGEPKLPAEFCNMGWVKACGGACQGASLTKRQSPETQINRGRGGRACRSAYLRETHVQWGKRRCFQNSPTGAQHETHDRTKQNCTFLRGDF